MSQTREVAQGLLCTQEELDEMCRTGVELMHEAIDSGDTARTAEMFMKIQNARIDLIDLFANWSGATLAYVLEHHGEQAMIAAFDPEEWLELGLDTNPTRELIELGKQVTRDPDAGAERLVAALRDDGPPSAKAYWAEVERATLALHDYRLDWSTSILSQAYRNHGLDGLNGALLHAGEQEWWQGRMVGDLADDPVTRIQNWSFFLGVGNFGTVSVSEDAERFSIHHAVCGTCGRQELAGRYEAPWNFPRVTEIAPEVNFGDPNYTIYRAHLPVWHFVTPHNKGMPPWPAIDCSGIPGRCWFNIYKDPARTPARYGEKIAAGAS